LLLVAPEPVACMGIAGNSWLYDISIFGHRVREMKYCLVSIVHIISSKIHLKKQFVFGPDIILMFSQIWKAGSSFFSIV
jgi:hypothetical protein